MALLSVGSIKENDQVSFMPVIINEPGVTHFPITAPLTKQVQVFRDAGIIYEGSNPDEYVVNKTGQFITSIDLKTALSSTEILQIVCYR